LSEQNTGNTRLDADASLQGVGSIGQNVGTINFYASPPNEASTRQPLAHNLSLKYLADRDEQERMIRQHLVRLRTSRRPTLFFVHGEASQQLDGFIDRLGKETMRRLLRPISSLDQLECKPIAWPHPGEHDKLAAYMSSLMGALDLVNGTADEIVDRASLRRCPVLLTSVHREVVDNNDEPIIRAILEFWASLPDLRSELSLIIVVAMIYAEAKPGLFARFRSQPKVSLLGRKLMQFNDFLSDRLNVIVLPKLADVSLDEAEHWVRNWLRPPDIEDALRRIRQAFGATGAPLPMALLDKHLEALAPENRARLRLQ
jgi:hypothetical protein